MSNSDKEKWNHLLNFLAAKPENPSLSAEVLILAGNCLPYLTREAGKMVMEGRVETLVLSGGVGHATAKLRDNYARLGYQFSKRLNEAEMNAAYLMAEFSISEEQLVLEKHSTNCGENARFTRDLFTENSPRTIYLMNDPILQRRTRATFEKEWEQVDTQFENYVPVVPELISLSQSLSFRQKELTISWSQAYFKALVLGEFLRMQDTTNGYGSKGLGYMNDIIIPAETQAIFLDLYTQEEQTELSR
ncbi:hypothetical protein BAU15_11075 [Enterococcus sp. JM4C]|uniref:YdcF family protein n=1 Tax=Candidatus Enterococcus huntleyi TaxID=1857217 RepID=UPI00137AD20F|nr:YdcF family protein [Enterococcus sp. JM4C]KAF1298660.1 hypothetical protein BAU15_11075 [Enterococcus sp. JM4C]